MVNNQLIDSQGSNGDLNTTITGEAAKQKPFEFQTHFAGYMEMHSDADTVAEYLDAHEGWFCRCAEPMKVEPLGNNGYTLTVGRFGSFGYEVEPKMSVILEPPENGSYLMYSIPVPDYTPPGYEVDYRAVMELTEITNPQVITQVDWQLHLKVKVNFPQFIHKLPQSIIQSTGDRLLAQIVKQVSPRLTYKVQKDFHTRLDLPIPPKSSRNLQKITADAQSESE